MDEKASNRANSLSNDSLNSVFDKGDVEVDNKSESQVHKLEIGQQLSQANGMYFEHGLDLAQHSLIHQ